MTTDLNKLAIKVARREGKKVNLPIGQIKEVLRCTFELLAMECEEKDVKRIVRRYANKLRKRGKKPLFERRFNQTWEF